MEKLSRVPIPPAEFVPGGAVLKSSIGWVDIRVDGDAVTELHWRTIEPKVLASSPLAEEAKKQVAAYLDGRLTRFDLPLRYQGSDLARGVWELMLQIPYGGTRKYGDLAKDLGSDGDYEIARNVGTACGRNPIAIIIPCHRVVGAATLGGYSSDLGLTAKRFLLDIEKGQERLF